MTHVELRDYQEACLAALKETRTDEVWRIAVEMATGLGKTITFGAEAVDYLNDIMAVGTRVLVLVHTDELVRQAVAKLRLMVKSRAVDGLDFSIGVVKADQDEIDRDIVVASVQTLAVPGRMERIKSVGHVIVDECHHAVAPTYQRILRHFGALPVHHYDDEGPRTPVTGYTATLARGDGQSLGGVWQALAFSRSISWAIRRGHLVDIVAKRVEIPDLTLPAATGDFSDAALSAAMAGSIAPHRVAEVCQEEVPGETIAAFVSSRAIAREWADAFNDHGIRTEVVHGDLPAAERAAMLQRLEDGATQAVVNCMVLTEGWDCPRVKVIVIGRPTKSVPLLKQMVGRGLRPWLGPYAPPREAQRCLLLFVTDSTTDLVGMPDLSDRPGLEAADGKTLTQLEGEWDLGRDIEPDPVHAYAGELHLVQFDPLVARSTKAWKYTEAGTPFLPTAKKSQGYVFLVREGETWSAFTYEGAGAGRATRRERDIPDLELAMVVAEDLAQEYGGDIGRLVADKDRAWRKQVPSADLVMMADRLGIDPQPFMADRRSGKAGRLSDRVEIVKATRRLGPIVAKIKAKTGQGS